MGNKDPFDDIAALRIDPTDSAYAVGPKPKKKWRRRFIKVQWSWVDRLKATNRGTTTIDRLEVGGLI